MPAIDVGRMLRQITTNTQALEATKKGELEFHYHSLILRQLNSLISPNSSFAFVVYALYVCSLSKWLHFMTVMLPQPILRIVPA